MKKRSKTIEKRTKAKATAYPEGDFQDSSMRVCEPVMEQYGMKDHEPTFADVWKGFLAMQQETRALKEENQAMWKRFTEEEAKRRAEERAEEEKCRAEERAAERAEERAEEKAEEEKRRAEDQKRLEEYAKHRAKEDREAKKRMSYLENLFVGQWGKLMEQLVNGDLVRLLRERHIDIEQTTMRTRGCVNGESFEFDIIAHDGDTVVIVEVKTTLQPDDVKEFIQRLNHARVLLPIYKDKKILGAVGYLTENAEASRMAQKDGLFAIHAVGGGASIVNSSQFVPRAF